MLHDFSKCAQSTQLDSICTQLINLSTQAFNANNGNKPRWEQAIEQIKTQHTGSLDFVAPYLNISADINNLTLEKSLKQLMPWRKGPYQIGDLQLDSEWRGDMKWHRIIPYIKPLKDKVVLDVGSGNGYFTYLMAISDAKIALGIEPFLLFNYQFQAIRTLIKRPPNAFILPLHLEEMPKKPLFDTVFSMGVLYHQKDHGLHLKQLRNVMQLGAELILETLIIDLGKVEKIIPKERYAKMRNVYCLPSTNTLRTWLEDAKFKNIKLLDITKTTSKEQQATHWIGNNTQSLKDFLDPNNNDLTIEGLPAPRRAIFICQK
jgi:tRNA (mo5U34)-methyltransferase